MKKDIIIFGDGACSGNPGPGGYGAIILFPDHHVQELAKHEPQTTNNRMEISAILNSIHFIMTTKHFESADSVQIFTDSVYLIRGVTQWMFGWKKRGWKNAASEPIANPDLWMQMDKTLYQAKLQNPKLKWEWNFVKGHAGIDGNERCDQLAVAMSKNNQIDIYSGPASSYLFDILKLPDKRPLPEMKSAKDVTAKKTTWYLSLVNGILKTHATWPECEALVKGRPGVKFKKVSSEEEESAVKKGWGI